MTRRTTWQRERIDMAGRTRGAAVCDPGEIGPMTYDICAGSSTVGLHVCPVIRDDLASRAPGNGMHGTGTSEVAL